MSVSFRFSGISLAKFLEFAHLVPLIRAHLHRVLLVTARGEELVKKR